MAEYHVIIKALLIKETGPGFDDGADLGALEEEVVEAVDNTDIEIMISNPEVDVDDDEETVYTIYTLVVDDVDIQPDVP